ncbi:hypothetical protein [Actinomadura soli]|uniref:hypothetical protein n=1 Tax=Actinomadura soli TaxID=2508997 RepID=UPI001485DD14|nr:hypothetical protein [Actinomadura soli]
MITVKHTSPVICDPCLEDPYFAAGAVNQRDLDGEFIVNFVHELREGRVFR